jgi:O-antigen ligase
LLLLSGLSLTWTSSVTLTMLEVERTAVYAVLVAGLVLIAQRADEILYGLVAAATLIAAWALFEHLILDRDVDAYQGALLTGTIGYANALGAVAAIGSVAAAGLGAEARGRWPYVAAAQLLFTAVALTNSRGAQFAWLLGMLVAIALSRARVRLAVVAVFVALSALCVGLAASELGVTRAKIASPDVVWEGRVVFLLVLGTVGAAALFARALPANSLRVGSRVAYAALAVLVAATAVGLFLARPDVGDRSHYWGVAADAFRSEPVIGHGPGTFERLWLEHRPVARDARDAHSLYLETLAEQGIVGGVLLVAVLALPLAVVVRRRGMLAAAAGGSYVTYLAHAGVDWDWEMPAVTAAGLMAGVACVKLARTVGVDRVGARARLALTGALVVVLAGSAFTLAGNWRVTNARDQLAANRPASALVSATRAASLQPWSSEALVLNAQSRLLLGDPLGAHDELARAVARDPTVWLGWWLLSLTSEGSQERALAAQQAAHLNPFFGRVEPTP